MHVPVEKPTRAFSPPSNPAIHHELIGPNCLVGIPSKHTCIRIYCIDTVREVYPAVCAVYLMGQGFHHILV